MEHHNHQIHRLLYNWDDKPDDDADESAPSNYFARLMQDDIVLFIWLVTAISCAALFICLFTKWYLEWRFGIRCCSSNGRERRRIISRDAFIASTQRIRDATIAAEREKKLDEEARRAEVERKRELLSEVTITVEKHHLEYDQDDLQVLEEGAADPQNDDGDNAVVLHVPGQCRTSAECRICLANVAAGEKIIRSPNSDCIHIFHDECILSWLSESKAKSDCPCCRLPFIPEGYDDDVPAAAEKEKEPTINDPRASSNDSTRTMSSSDESQNTSSDTDESEGFDEEEREDSPV